MGRGPKPNDIQIVQHHTNYQRLKHRAQLLKRHVQVCAHFRDTEAWVCGSSRF